jgi:hypothetical protein
MPLPATWDQDSPGTELEPREDYFGYEPPPGGRPVVEWYLNFANDDLFAAYGGPLFAQDEMQVAEHPTLGSLREALLQSGIAPLSVENGEPTPALIMGVERRCRVATDPNPALGRPHGLYGNHFARASAAAIERATEAIIPPTITNLIAMEAPPGGSGLYTGAEIAYILGTAFSGFAAARIESQSSRDAARPTEVAIHTGFWGCGAYGGNRVLMAVLQLLAATLARVDRLVFHTGNAPGSQALAEAQRVVHDVTPEGRALAASQVMAELESMGFAWGVSDGN